MSPERRLLEAQIANTLDNANKDEGTIPDGWDSLEARQDAGADAADYMDQVDAGAMTLETAFNRLKTKYGSEATDEALWALLGGVKTTTETPTTTPTATSPGLGILDRASRFVNQGTLGGQRYIYGSPETSQSTSPYSLPETSTPVEDQVYQFLFKI